MRYFFTALLSIFTLSAIANPQAQQPQPEQKNVTVKFGGQIDILTYFDTYNSVETRNGLQYWFPKAPAYNAYGEDVNFQNRLRFSVGSTRLNTTINVAQIGKATGKGFVEVDFMGTNESNYTGIRLRHAYFTLNWEKRSLLIGQTSHLAMIEDIAPSTVTFGGGFPINTLNRPVQIRFTQKFLKKSSFDIALAMFGSNEGDMQSYAITPDLHARLNFGFGDHTFGFAAGMEILKPRNLTADSTRTTKLVVGFDALAYYKVKIRQHSLAAYFIWGQDADALALLGGYAPLYSDRKALDYRYAPTSTISAWLNYQSPTYNGFFFSFFLGGQKNLGSTQQLDLSKANISHFGADAYARFSPQLVYQYKMLTFGLEYMLAVASWGKTFDNYYRPTQLHPTTFNNRISLLARFKF